MITVNLFTTRRTLSHRRPKLIHHRRRLYAGECRSHSVRADVDDLRERDRDLAVAIDQRLGIDDRHADEPPLSVEAQRVTLGRLVEVHSGGRIADMQVEHVDVDV